MGFHRQGLPNGAIMIMLRPSPEALAQGCILCFGGRGVTRTGLQSGEVALWHGHGLR